MRNVVVIGTGSYVPKTVVTNAELVEELRKITPDTTEEWIVKHTGVMVRRVAAPGEHTSDMALEASLDCLRKAGVDPKEVDLIVGATVSGDTNFPAMVNWLQGKLQCQLEPEDRKRLCSSFDINAGCSGFMSALNVTTALLQTGRSNLALVVGAEKMSVLYNPKDRNSYPLAGDGAACVLLRGIEPSANLGGYGIRGFYSGSDGRMAHLLVQPLGGTSQPLTAENINDPGRYLQMDGPKVYQAAVRKMSESVEAILKQVGVRKDEVDWFIGHQANLRILEAVAEKLGVPMKKVYSNIHKYGNTTSASIPLCLDELSESGQLKPGHEVVLFTFGTGFTWGSCFLTWGS